MKKLMFIVMAALTMAAACSKAYDDSDLQKRLDKVESEIGSVKAALEGYKAQVTAYQAFITAFENGSHVSSIDQIKDGDKVLGYRISFEGGIAPVEIMHGRDGVPGQDGEAGYTPVLGIAQEDGRFYWTVDGNVRKDMPASPDVESLGIKNGETPEILVEDGKWILQTSKGKEVLGPVSDSDVLVADDVFGNVGQTGGELTITLANGTVMEFPLLQEYAVAIDDTADPFVKGYRISGKFTTPALNVFCPAGWKAQVQSAEGGLSGIIRLTAASVRPGEYTFNVLVSDGTRSASASFTATVSDNQ